MREIINGRTRPSNLTEVRMRARNATALAALAASVGLVVAAASPANAATNPYTPGEVCGAGYRTVSGGTYALYGAKVYVMYNSSSGRNCVATIKTANIGTATGVGAGLKLSGTAWKSGTNYEYGQFKYYAKSPTNYYAKGKCIDIYGAAGSNGIAQYRVFCG